MINYFEAAEKTLRARGLLETALGNLERKKERILRYGAPSEYPSADMSKPYTGAKSVNDALADCLELAEVMREIQVTRDKVEEIDDVLAQMDEDDARILRLWYIERKSKLFRVLLLEKAPSRNRRVIIGGNVHRRHVV